MRRWGDCCTWSEDSSSMLTETAASPLALETAAISVQCALPPYGLPVG